jgi:GNAT superfamily N-acetyltransferase
MNYRELKPQDLKDVSNLPMKVVAGEQGSDDSIRYIRKDELKTLLELYKHLNEEDPVLEETEGLTALWEDILNDPHQHYLIAEADGRPVSSCVLVIINNLTRGAKPYGLIENVVTHKDYRNKGYGSKLLKKAVAIARDKGCYKVMLMSGRGEETLEFYEKAGFDRGRKTGFIIRF